MEDKTDEARVSLPVLFRSLFFHEASLFCIFSIMNRKSLLLGRPLRIGKPRYLSREVVPRMPEIDVNLLIFAWGVPEEKRALDLERLIFNPEALLKLSNKSETNLNWELLALVKRRTSSANRRWDKGPEFVMCIGSQFHWRTALLIAIDNFSMQRMKRYGESGSPCRRPCVGLKLGNLFPFHKIEKVDKETQCIINLMVMLGKPKSWRQLLRNSQLTLSKSFSRSSLKATYPFFFLDFLLKWTISFKTIELSEVPLPDRKLLW